MSNKVYFACIMRALWSATAFSVRIRRRSFPAALLGMASVSSTPPRSFMNGFTRSSTHCCRASAEGEEEDEDEADEAADAVPFFRTTKALGTSPLDASGAGIPTTAASYTSGWDSSSASSSAGATW